MDFKFSQQEAAFREEVREFIRRELPPEWKSHFKVVLAPSIYTFTGEALEFIKTIRRRVGEKGWLSLGWPEQYGGKNSLFLQNIVYEEMLYHNCPGIEPVGALFLAPALIKFGSEDQKQRFLPYFFLIFSASGMGVRRPTAISFVKLSPPIGITDVYHRLPRSNIATSVVPPPISMSPTPSSISS